MAAIRSLCIAPLAALLFALPACDGSVSKDNSADGNTGGDPNKPTPTPEPGKVAPTEARDAKEVDAPAGFEFTSAPGFDEPVKFIANRSSVMLYLPFVKTARDYRVFALVDGVKIALDGDKEDVRGATITCAGLRQRNQCDDNEALKEYGPGYFDIAACSEDIRSVHTPPTLLRQIEVNGLKGETILAVEAVDSLCPFVGAPGNAHKDVPILGSDKTQQATYMGKLADFPPSRRTFPIRTEQEIRDQYGSLILNGHGHAPRDADSWKGPFYNLAQPAPPVQPRVLGRAIISIAPLGTKERPAGYKDSDIFEDFEDDTDQFKLIKARNVVEPVILPEGFGPIQEVKLYQNKNWNWYTFNAEATQVYIDKGQLHMTLADIGQDVMASNVIYPTRPIQVPDDADSYIHIAFEIQTDATQRRYWWLHLCGAAEKGKTYDGRTLPNEGGIVARPFFMNPTSGPTISMGGWNCMDFVPRSGDYEVQEGGDVQNPALENKGRPEADLRIFVNRPTAAGMDPTKDMDSVILLDPAMNPGDKQELWGSWTRTWDDNHKINGVMLDDTMFVHQRTHVDVFVNRTRVVFYANGKQKACDDFAAHKLTMAEAAVGIGHVFYHSSAERLEFTTSQWIRTGQNYYLHNTPFVDVRSLDNVGIQEGVGLPASFNPKPCYTTPE